MGMSDAPPAHREKKRTISPFTGADATRFQFKAGNPGRPAAGAVVQEWYNAMAGYSLEDLLAVIADPKAKAAKVAAAHQWLAAVRDADRAALIEVCDRTHGQSVKRVDQVSQVQRIKRVVVPARKPGEN